MQSSYSLPITTQVGIFILTKARNAWLENKYMRVYVRRSRRMIDSVIEETFDVANISVYPKYQKQGYFKSFMQYIETLGLTIYVESLSNSELTEMLLKHGYILDSSGQNAYKRSIKQT